jgi:hypothetical protein
MVVERYAEGVTIRVPPGGLWRGTKGLFTFSLIWLTFTAFMSAFLVPAALADNGAGDGFWLLPLCLAIFWLSGIGFLLMSWNMGRREAVFAVTGSRFMLLQIGPFGSKQREWTTDELDTIRVGPSGMEVNDEPVQQLQIVDRMRKSTNLLAGRSDEELEWLASELRHAIRLPSPGSHAEAWTAKGKK